MLLQTNGTRIRELRQLAGLTLAEFAEAVGYTYNYVSQIELGHVNGGIRFLRAAATVLHCTIEDITAGRRTPARSAA
jgi:transcriptional regulator with XRE-family HTH domain